LGIVFENLSKKEECKVSSAVAPNSISSERVEEGLYVQNCILQLGGHGILLQTKTTS
jgi:hypothetical protein